MVLMKARHKNLKFCGEPAPLNMHLNFVPDDACIFLTECM